MQVVPQGAPYLLWMMSWIGEISGEPNISATGQSDDEHNIGQHTLIGSGLNSQNMEKLWKEKDLFFSR